MAKIECSNRLRVILAEKEITNRWLAEQMGVTDMTVSRWKTNKVQPSMAQFVEIAQLLKVDIKDLIEADFNYDITTVQRNFPIRSTDHHRSHSEDVWA